MKNKNDQSLAASVAAGSGIPERGGIRHTPGPWDASQFPVRIGDCLLRWQIWGEHRVGYRVGFTEYHGNNEEEDANARLIAAAPELLAVLIEAIEHCDGWRKLQQDDSAVPFLPKILEQDFRVAIEKATISTRTSHPNPASYPNSNTKES